MPALPGDIVYSIKGDIIYSLLALLVQSTENSHSRCEKLY